MNRVPSPPARTYPAARPLLALDRDELRLSSPHGNVVSGVITLTNRGEAPLEGTVLARVGGEWLRIEPAVVRLAPSEARRVEVQGNTTHVGHLFGASGIPSRPMLPAFDYLTGARHDRRSVRQRVQERSASGPGGERA
jgi:hypothetical protein